MDDAAADAITRRVGGRGNRRDGPGTDRSVGDLNGLGHLDVEDEGGHGTGLGCRLGSSGTRSRHRRRRNARSHHGLVASFHGLSLAGLGGGRRGPPTAHVGTQLRELLPLTLGRTL